MSETITFSIDGQEVSAEPGQTILEAADAAGIYIPRLCAHSKLAPWGACRVCTVKVNGRPQSACTQPAAEGAIVENDTEELNTIRRDIVEMLFVEGNHFCPFCQRSGDCELQAMGYRLGLTSPKYPFLWNQRDVDASHPEIYIDRNRCILCARCVRASKDLDGKNVFQFVGRGPEKRVAVNAEARLSDTDLSVTDKAVDICPVGAILKKHGAYDTPVGQRHYDKEPIGSEIEKK
jgi:[NiFe] hydrogenase diaphorase moiety small subunit